jgi:peptidoglycan lytic transglycosylase
MVGRCLSLAILLAVAGSVSGNAAGKKVQTSNHKAGGGTASVYSYKGQRTANGEVSRPGGFTAAHRSLPFGTKVRVTNRKTKRSVVVRINDRGPFVRGRVIDVTPAAARHLGFSGLASVSLQVVGR